MAVCSVTFQHEMTPARAQERPQRLSRNDQVRRGVYVQPGRLGQILGSCEGRLERGSLELDSEANRGGLGEQGLRVGTVGEARQGFIADDRIARQIDYRLEDRVEGSRVDDARDALATPAHQGPFRDVAADQSPGEVGELDQRRQHFRDGHFLHGSLGVDHEQPDELLVRSNGRISNRVDAEAAQEISVRIPRPFHPGLDPGSVMGSLVQPLTVLGGDLLQRGVGPAPDDETNQRSASVQLEERDLRGLDAGEVDDLAANCLCGGFGRVGRSEASERFGDKSALPRELGRALDERPLLRDVAFDGHKARDRARGAADRRNDRLLGE